jgi:hypothetical protein
MEPGAEWKGLAQFEGRGQALANASVLCVLRQIGRWQRRKVGNSEVRRVDLGVHGAILITRCVSGTQAGY